MIRIFYEFYHPVANDYYVFQKDEDFSFSSHLHYCFELIVVTDGGMVVRVDEREYTLSAGEAVLIFPNQVHSMSTPVHSRSVLCIFSPNLISAFSTKLTGRVPVDNRFVPSGFYIDRMIGYRNGADRIHLKGLLYSLAAEFDERAEYMDAGAAGAALLASTIFRFIEERYTEDCSLSTLARKVGYDYAYLSSYFKKTVGIPYNEYVNRYRVSKACYLLSNCGRTILEISAECGFNSLRSMNRNFRKQTGMTPAEYRRQDHTGGQTS